MTTEFRFPFVFTLICLFVIVSTQISLATSVCPDCDKDDRLCGPKCMLSICQKLGVEANIDEMTNLCRYDEKNGTSMAGLLDAAKAKGFETVGMKISANELTALKTSAIAHLWNNHFVVVEAESADKLKVTDPPAEPQVVPVEDFQKVYSGFALLIAKDRALFPNAETKGSDIRVNSYTWDFGVVEDEKPLEHTFTFRNAGNEPLVISKVDSSCGCAALLLSQYDITPGSKAEVKAMFDPRGRKGAQKQTVYIHSNDPVTPVVQLQIAGGVQPSRIQYSPRTISLGETRRKESISREIFLPKSETRPFEIEKASPDVPFMSTAITTREDKSGYVVKLALLPDKAPIGEVKGTVTILTNHPKDPKIEIPVTATVKGDIEVFPDTLFFGMLKKGEGGRKKISISTKGEQAFSIEKIDNPMPDHLVVRATPADDGKQCTLTATLTRDMPAGYINGKVVTVHTNNPDQPELKITVYALVED